MLLTNIHCGLLLQSEFVQTQYFIYKKVLGYFHGTILPPTYPIFYFDGGYSGLRVKGSLQKHTS